MMKKISAALVLATLFSTASAHAATIEFDASKGMTTTNWSDTLSFGKFDTRLGTLNAIKFVLDGSVAGSGRAESLDGSATTITLSLASTLTLTRPDGTTLVVTNPVFSAAHDVASFDGAIDFRGASGWDTGAVANSASNSFTSASAADFTLFSAAGGGTIDLNLQAAGNSTGTGAGNLITQFATSAGAGVKVVYDYTALAPVPEPETYGMMLLGLGVIGAAARRRARNRQAV
ncbi:choice-of-anchor E domain-containing protein [Pseudoduganella chitinolytica]|uniref:Choice-of-anchor E domain-containing protein n=1 Tax=Pseudoduganella chitinolytica TaxID=34070 RepID=A0ABY8BH00_9BURK|nr:choice-of-anchor E domain-containing protein [Pseudoduganella chitinolytica]WEF34593.1 choice-of-anchor E domain-containing protein [Pseudoduganella chitinolytica]